MAVNVLFIRVDRSFRVFGNSECWEMRRSQCTKMGCIRLCKSARKGERKKEKEAGRATALRRTGTMARIVFHVPDAFRRLAVTLRSCLRKSWGTRTSWTDIWCTAFRTVTTRDTRRVTRATTDTCTRRSPILKCT